MIADGLSRNPVLSSLVSNEENNEFTVCFLLKCSPIDLKRVAHETSLDKKLREVISAVRDGWQSSLCRRLKPYFSLRDELSIKVCNNSQPDSVVLMKGDLVVIPDSLVTEVLDLLHEGHLGTTKMKQLIRSCGYWPNFSKAIDDYVRRCQSCTIHQRISDTPALTPIANTVQAPYDQIAIDLTGPSSITKSKVLLTIIDYYSRYPEAYVLNVANAREILVKLRQTFARYGIPKSVVSDNGSVFKSKEISDFFNELGIQHIFTSNYHPQSNGTVERLHFTLKSRLARILNAGHEWNAALDKVLFDVRSTINAITGKTPFQMFFGRPMRTKLAALTEVPRELCYPSRDIVKEYRNKLRGRNIEFACGDAIYFRKEDGTFFRYPGTIMKVCGNHSYEVEDFNGQRRIYNQSHLKRRFGEAGDDEDWQDAYDAAAKKHNEQETETNFRLGSNDSQEKVVSSPIRQRCEGQGRERYFLRRRKVDPRVYRC